MCMWTWCAGVADALTPPELRRSGASRSKETSRGVIMSWLWRADADGGTDGEGTPRRAESADGMPSDMGQWEESNAAAAEGIATGNSGV